MNAPFRSASNQISLANLADPGEVRRIEAYVAQHGEGDAFHRPAWLLGAAAGTGNRALALTLESGGELAGYLPLIEIHSPLFGRVMASTGFGVGGGMLVDQPGKAKYLFAALEELCLRRSVPSTELRGGVLPKAREGWSIKRNSHCGFVLPLAADDEAQLNTIPRKQRAEVRKGLAGELTVTTGSDARHRAAHYAVYAESVRNLGTPVFPRSLFDAVLNTFGDEADILVVWSGDAPVSAVLSLYHKGAVMPYWGGGTWDARRLRANDRMYYELMLHARRRGCERFDFGRSKTDSGAYHFKRNWGFEPEPLSYAVWTAPGAEARDADPTSQRHAARIALWKRLPLPIANLIGPHIARGLG
ncbi:FemAB family XrtA/PEP-CTERM system-associated protein [Novosphingobium sp.]|uniref:FemAB family XrtA/PEP-CTERM system-associated protein n=1 Tax=Novosphingobium sp. TaxID=1874826 RepID=UPI00286BA790|nr:FemAB family XrtA/PEP-CTERM system-associated protein [Novosphingobium sp.]